MNEQAGRLLAERWSKAMELAGAPAGTKVAMERYQYDDTDMIHLTAKAYIFAAVDVEASSDAMPDDETIGSLVRGLKGAAREFAGGAI
jgi:hypothetical protein